MKQHLLNSLILLFALIAGTATSWADEGDVLAICEGTGNGYGTRRTMTDIHSVKWVLSTGQSGYLGANSATNHNKVKPTAADLPVVKAVKADATASTTGYYFYYTTTPVSNVGSIEFSYTGNSGNTSATAYVVVGDAVAASGGAAYEQIELSSESPKKQGVSLGTSGTFTFKFKETQRTARYYGVVIVAESYKRMTDGTIKLLEGDTPAVDHINIAGYKTNFYIGDEFSYGGTVTAVYSDATEDDVTAAATFSGYNLTTEGVQTVTVSYRGKSATYEITVSERPKFTVTYSDGGFETESSVGSGVSLPSRSDVGEYTFLGWAESNISVETQVAPTFYTGTYHPADHITLYPVYKRSIDGETAMPTATLNVGEYASANKWTNSSKHTTININANLTATASAGANTGKYYASDLSWRFYDTEKATLTIEAKNGYELTSVKLTYSEGVFKYNGNEITSANSVAVSGTSAVFSCTTKAFVNSISVDYKMKSIAYYTSIPVTEQTITLSSACKDGSVYYGTYSSSHGFIVPADLTVSTISVSAGKMTLSNYNAGDIVKANTGVLISATSAGDKTVTLASGGTELAGNMLKASGDAGIDAAAMGAAADCKFYRLTMHGGTQIGFFWGAEDGAAFDVAANKAYLAVPNDKAVGVKGFRFGENTDAISEIMSNGENEKTSAIYDLSGRRVVKPTKGLYIVNGKKVVK